MRHGLDVALLRRPGREHQRPRDANRLLAELAKAGGRVIDGDLADMGALSELVAGADTVVHLVGIIREAPRRRITFDEVVVEGTRRVVGAARSAGIARFILMSALGANPADPLPYPRTKGEAEQIVRRHGFVDTVIFRPSVIYGPGDGFVSLLAGMLRRFPVLPIFGDGLYQLQPVPVWVMAQAVAQASAAPLPAAPAGPVVRVIDVGGADRITYQDLVRAVAERIGVRPRLFHVPMGLSRFVAGVGERVPGFPLARQQLELLVRGSTGDVEPFYREFNVPRLAFREGIWAYEL